MHTYPKKDYILALDMDVLLGTIIDLPVLEGSHAFHPVIAGAAMLFRTSAIFNFASFIMYMYESVHTIEQETFARMANKKLLNGLDTYNKLKDRSKLFSLVFDNVTNTAEFLHISDMDFATEYCKRDPSCDQGHQWLSTIHVPRFCKSNYGGEATTEDLMDCLTAMRKENAANSTFLHFQGGTKVYMHTVRCTLLTPLHAESRGRGCDEDVDPGGLIVSPPAANDHRQYSLSMGLVFINIPKTGGSSIERVMRVVDPDHRVVGGHFGVSAYEVSRFHAPEFTYITFVRNPYGRLASAYAYLTVGRHNEGDTRLMNRVFPGHIEDPDMGKFLDELTLDSMNSVMHFKPMSTFCIDRKLEFRIDYVFSFEDMQTSWGIVQKLFPSIRTALPHTLQHTGTVDVAALFSTEARRSTVQDLFKLDFHLFGYSDDVSNVNALPFQNKTCQFYNERLHAYLSKISAA
jgi:hypothetical protein